MNINYSIFLVKLLKNPKQYFLIDDENFITEVEVKFFVDSLKSKNEKDIQEKNHMIIRAWDGLGDVLFHLRKDDFLVVEGELSIDQLAKNEVYIIKLENLYPCLDFSL